NNIILHCVLIDITDRILTQQKLMQRSLEFETVSENLPGGILMTYMDKSLTIAYANDGYLSMLGLSGENILGAEALTFIPPKDRDMVSATIHEQLATSDYISLEHRLLVYGGGEIWVSANSKRIISVNGKPMAVWVLVNISRIKETEQALRISEERYRVAIKNTNHIIFDYNVASKELLYSSDAVNAYGLPQLVHNAPQAISDSGAICPESMAEYLSCFDRIIAGEATTCCTVKSKTLDGTIVWNKITLSAIYDDSGNAIRAVGSIEDISHEKELEQKAQKEERYRDLLTKNALINYEIDFTNNVYLRGHEHLSSLSNLANDYSKILAFISKRNVYVDDRAKFLKTFSVEHVLSEFNAGVTRIELEYRKIDSGDPIWVKCSLCLLFDDDLNIVRGFSIVNDINEQKQHEFTLRDRAERDLQTGLYNKVSTEQRIDDFLISDDAQNGISAFMLIDIDNFKLVNDRLGHAYGDTALLKMAQILISLFRENDVIGRIGGDEFVVFVKNLHASELAEHKAADICRAFRDLFTVADDMRITASVGISILPYDGSSFDELYQKADIALYRAKNAGKDSVALFSSEPITE
ncbi:MAG: sensor domain-containing diguanylate cyclase, partial [Clostridia bacterium]